MRRPALLLSLATVFVGSCGPRTGPTDSSRSVATQWVVGLEVGDSASDFASTSDIAVGAGGVGGVGELIAVGGGYAGPLSIGPVSLPASSDPDGYVAVLGPDGSPRWARSVQGPGFDHVRAVAVSRDGRVALAGAASSGASLAGTPLPATFVATLSDTGKPLWVAGIASSDHGAIADLAFADNGDLVAVGYASGTTRAGDHTVVSAGSHDAIVVRFDRKGTAVWLRRAGGRSADHAHGVAIRGQDIAVAGGFAGNADFAGAPLRSNHNQDGFVAMLRADGRLRWINTFGGSARDAAMTVSATDEQIVVAGTFESQDANFGTGVLRADSEGAAGFVAAYGGKGQPRWSVRIGDGASDALAVGARGTEVWVGGSYQGAQIMDVVELPARGKRDAMVLSLDAEGAATSGLGLGGAGHDQLSSLALTSSGDLVLAGVYSGSVTIGGQRLSAAGSSGFIARLSPGR